MTDQDKEGSGDLYSTTTTLLASTTATFQPYDYRTTGILLVVALIVSFLALYICFWACKRKRKAPTDDGMARMLTDDLELPVDGQPYLSLAMRGSNDNGGFNETTFDAAKQEKQC